MSAELATITVRVFPAIIDLGSRSSWGECWWTARDICLANQPQLPDPVKAIADAYERRLVDRMLNG